VKTNAYTTAPILKRNSGRVNNIRDFTTMLKYFNMKMLRERERERERGGRKKLTF